MLKRACAQVLRGYTSENYLIGEERFSCHKEARKPLHGIHMARAKR